MSPDQYHTCRSHSVSRFCLCLYRFSWKQKDFIRTMRTHRSAGPQRRPPRRNWPPCQPAPRCQPPSAAQCSCTRAERGSFAAATHEVQTEWENHPEPGPAGQVNTGGYFSFTLTLTSSFLKRAGWPGRMTGPGHEPADQDLYMERVLLTQRTTTLLVK